MPVDSDTAAPAAEVERLYGLEPEAFVAARTAAAKELRGRGRRAEAAAVAGLRKPSVAAWIVNRLARDEPGLLADLLAAGERLAEVQLRAGDPRELRAAIAAETGALEALMRRAGPIAAPLGGGAETALRHVRETLHAAALDPDLAAEVRRGVLVRERQAVGFPMGVSVPPRPARPASRPKPAQRPRAAAPADAVSAKRRERAAAATAAAAAKLAAAAAEVERARADLAAAEADLEAARVAASTAERRAERARRAVAAADRAHAEAGRRARETAAHEAELGEAG